MILAKDAAWLVISSFEEGNIRMQTPVEKLRILETLVEELLKDAPEENIVSDCMVAAGIEDSKDPIDRINKVLLALNFMEGEKEIK